MITKELNHTDVLNILPDRNPEDHKGNFGKILLICGSRGYTGAPALSAMGALRCGAGLVFLAVPESIYEIEAIKVTEPIVIPLPDKNGCISREAIIQIRQKMHEMDAILIGPGMGCNEETFYITKTILEEYPGPVVLDADGINVLSGHIDILRGRTGKTILTPHMGEFKRMWDTSETDRITIAGALAGESNSIVLLKGHNTVITDGNVCYINPTGNPGMAVGGSGDVLAGMITALLGHGIAPLEAAACGAWLHGAAGDKCANEIGQYGMLPTDMLNVLPRLLK